MSIRNVEVPTCGGCYLRGGCQTGLVCLSLGIKETGWPFTENQMET